MTYAPRPNSIAARTIEALQALPAGAELCGSDIAHRLNENVSSLSAALDQARVQGALVRRMDGKRAWWSLGNGTPLEGAPKPRPGNGARIAPPAPVEPAKAVDRHTPQFDPAWRPPQMVCVRPGAEPLPKQAPPAQRTTAGTIVEQLEAEGAFMSGEAPQELTVDVDEEADEFDAVLSARTGCLVLVGATIGDDGTVTLQPDQVQLVKRIVAWSPAP